MTITLDTGAYWIESHTIRITLANGAGNYDTTFSLDREGHYQSAAFIANADSGTGLRFVGTVSLLVNPVAAIVFNQTIQNVLLRVQKDAGGGADFIDYTVSVTMKR